MRFFTIATLIVVAVVVVVAPTHATHLEESITAPHQAAAAPAAAVSPATTSVEAPHYGWIPVPHLSLPATYVRGGSADLLSYGVCRYCTGGECYVGKVTLIRALGTTTCTIAPNCAGKDMTVWHGFEVLVSANQGTWVAAAPSVGVAPGSATPQGGSVVPVPGPSSTQYYVGRAREAASGDEVPGSAGIATGGDAAHDWFVCYGDSKEGQRASQSASSVLVDTGVCPDYKTSTQTCGADRIVKPGADCLFARIIARPLNLDDTAAAAAAAAPSPQLECLNHQAFVYLGRTANYTSGYYGFGLEPCSHILCGRGLLCNDVWPGTYHFIAPKDLCQEPTSYLDREFECSKLAAAEAVVRPQYDTCNHPTALPYQLTIAGHNCHNYVIDVVNAYDKMAA